MNYDPSSYPQGVPSPWVPNVQEYPSPQHGGDYTRPMFGLPWVRTPYNVYGPPGNKYALGQLASRPRSPWAHAAMGSAAVGLTTYAVGAMATAASDKRIDETPLVFTSIIAGAAAFFVVGLVASKAAKEGVA